MSQTIYTDALARGVELEGSVQSLANLLRVPESTLERWMSGRAQMPLQAFLMLIKVISQHEARATGETHVEPRRHAAQISPDGTVTLTMGPLTATCAACDGTKFALAEPNEPLRYISELVCRSCGARVVHGNLATQLAKEAVNQIRAANIARARRQDARTEMIRKLREPKEE